MRISLEKTLEFKKQLKQTIDAFNITFAEIGASIGKHESTVTTRYFHQNKNRMSERGQETCAKIIKKLDSKIKEQIDALNTLKEKYIKIFNRDYE